MECLFSSVHLICSLCACLNPGLRAIISIPSLSNSSVLCRCLPFHRAQAVHVSETETWRLLINLLYIRKIILEMFAFPNALTICCTCQAFALWDRNIMNRWHSTTLGHKGWFPSKRGLILSCISLACCSFHSFSLFFFPWTAHIALATALWHCANWSALALH